MFRDIREVEFTVFDTETTGLEPRSGDRIIEIAAIRIKGDQRLATFQSFINPQREVSPAAFNVNHISNAMLANAPEAGQVLPRFLDFVKDSCLCCYNAGFDLGFLNNELQLLGCPPLEKIPVVDALKMARRTIPGLERYALWFVAQKLGIKTQQEHRALSDVQMTVDVFTKLRDMLINKGVSEFTNFCSLFGLGEHFLESKVNQMISEIQRAIDLKVEIKIKYFSNSTAQLTERRVIPKQIIQDNGQYYLVGYCSLRKDERTFRIDGILHLEII